jgi:hypothetical protein
MYFAPNTPAIRNTTFNKRLNRLFLPDFFGVRRQRSCFGHHDKGDAHFTRLTPLTEARRHMWLSTTKRTAGARRDIFQKKKIFLTI